MGLNSAVDSKLSGVSSSLLFDVANNGFPALAKPLLSPFPNPAPPKPIGLLAAKSAKLSVSVLEENIKTCSCFICDGVVVGNMLLVGGVLNLLVAASYSVSSSSVSSSSLHPMHPGQGALFR